MNLRMWMKDPATNKKSITTTMLVLWTTLTIAAFVLNLTGALNNIYLVLLGAAIVTFLLAMHMNKRIRISRDGVELGGSSETTYSMVSKSTRCETGDNIPADAPDSN